MAITRTSMVDDDGSGTTGTIINNAWKQELYGQIDGVAGSTPIAWTPIDQSGAGLTFTGVSAFYVRAGALVLFWLQVTFPATSNGAQASIGGLPVTAGLIHGGGYTTFGINGYLHFPLGATKFYLYNPTSAARTNAEMSGSTWICAGQYIAS